MLDPRESILACASDLYLTDGLDGLSMRKLAKEVGVTAPALYRYYDGREAVLADLVREAHRVFLGYLRRGLEAPTPFARFADAGDSYLDFALEHPRWFAIMFSGPERLGMDSIPDDIQSMGCAIHQFWNDRVSECMRAGVLKEGDPRDVSMTMWAHAHGLLQLYHQGRLNTDEAGFRRLVEESSARLFAGVMTDEFAARLTAQDTADGKQSSPVVAAQTGT
jgi:AcrR family transcriptional regulator